MKFEVLTLADYVLNSCGRLVPPAGFRFVDLPRFIPYVGRTPGGGSGEGPPPPNAVPTQGRVSNNANTLFVCKGIMLQNSCGVKIKWPNGRFLTQNPLVDATNPGGAPDGRGPSIIALNKPMDIDRGQRIGIEVSGQTGNVNIQFWGVLRYMIRESDAREASELVKSSCLVGYPAPAKTPGRIQMMDDPIEALNSRVRTICGPNQNIMAPEWYLGNQCVLETPAGYEDEAFTFFSNPISVAINGSSFGNSIVTPGGEDLVIRRFRVLDTFSDDSTSGTSLVQIRLPNGYSITGGDLIPYAQFDTWFPAFPTLVIQGQGGGGRIIIDVANQNGSGEGLITTTIEFDAAKRRKVA